MIDILPGYSSDLTAYEEAVAAAQGDGWQIKGFSICCTGSDTLIMNELWKEDAIPANAPPEAWGPNYGPKRAALRAKHAAKAAPAVPVPDESEEPKKPHKAAHHKK